MSQSITINDMMQSMMHAFIYGFIHGKTALLNESTGKSTIVLSDAITIGKDTEKEFIDIDVDKLEFDKFYLVSYKDGMYAVRKISKDNVAFYDVV